MARKALHVLNYIIYDCLLRCIDIIIRLLKVFIVKKKFNKIF